MRRNEIIRSAHIEKINHSMKDKKVAYFCAYTGSGKTMLLHQFFERSNKKYVHLSCRDEEFCKNLKTETGTGTDNIVIDDAQEGIAFKHEIISAICESKNTTRFYIVSRSEIPDYLMPYYITGTMEYYDQKFFSYSPEEIQNIFELNNKRITLETAEKIYKDSGGWFLGILVYVNNYDDNVKYEDLHYRCIRDIFEYFNERLWDQFSEELRGIMLRVGHLSEFTVEQAQLICRGEDTEVVLCEAEILGSFLSRDKNGKYKVEPFVTEYLTWKQETECSKEFRDECYGLTARYYEDKCDMYNAIKYYRKADNNEKVIELLLNNINNHVGNGNFYKLKDYYISLPEELIEESPELISTMSLLYSLMGDPETSELYFNMLMDYAFNTEDPEKKRTARNKIAYLSLTLPHRGESDMYNIIKKYAPAVIKGDISIQDVSITGNMPSVINGGKDFCKWTKNDRHIYNKIKMPLLHVLGKKSAGLMEIALAESLFEKNSTGNYIEELTLLSSGYYESETSGNIQLQFAAIAVMARIYVAVGKIGSAVEAVERLKKKIDPNCEIYDNIEAFRIYLAMLGGESKRVYEWYENSAPDENEGFYMLDRYCYLIKTRIYIIKGMYNEALSLLSRLEQYFAEYDREYCHLDAIMLKAILYYRMKNEKWSEFFAQALKKCEEYNFIQNMAKYGINVLEMINEYQSDMNTEYKEELLKNVKKQALYYPNYLKAEKSKDYGLTDSEKMVLKLICDGLSNEEISRLTDTAVRTVKFHLSNIYTKLNVKSRTGAINLCHGNGII